MTDTTIPPPSIAASATALARGFAVLRIFFGVIYLSNGLAKLFDVGVYDLGFATFGLAGPAPMRPADASGLRCRST